MPGSAVEGKNLVRNFIIKNNLRTFLDIGPGEATYPNAFKGLSFYAGLDPLPIDQIDGVEAWGPYVAQYALYQTYTNLIIADAYYLDWNLLPLSHYDMVLLGDVIEHMPRWQGESVIARAVEKASYVVVSLPIYGYAQHVGWEGNWFETHVEQYSDTTIKEVIAPYELLEEMQGSIVGVYIFCGKNSIRNT